MSLPSWEEVPDDCKSLTHDVVMYTDCSSSFSQDADDSCDDDAVSTGINVRIAFEEYEGQDTAAIQAILDEAHKKIQLVIQRGVDQLYCINCGDKGHISLQCEQAENDPQIRACRYGVACWHRPPHGNCRFAHPSDYANLIV